MTAASPAVSAPAPPSDTDAFAARLEELTRRAMVCVATVAACTAAMAPFYRLWFDLAIWPTRRYFSTGAAELQATVIVVDQTLAYAKACLVPGLMLAMPVLCYQVWAFACACPPGTRPPHVWRVVAASTFLFVAGVTFAYLVLLPTHLSFMWGAPGVVRLH